MHRFNMVNKVSKISCLLRWWWDWAEKQDAEGEPETILLNSKCPGSESRQKYSSNYSYTK